MVLVAQYAQSDLCVLLLTYVRSSYLLRSTCTLVTQSRDPVQARGLVPAWVKPGVPVSHLAGPVLAGRRARGTTGPARVSFGYGARLAPHLLQLGGSASSDQVAPPVGPRGLEQL